MGDINTGPGPLPRLTPAQRRDALDRAQVARRERAALLAAVRAGAVTVAEVLDRAGDPVVARTRVRHLVRAIPGLGEVRVGRVLAAAGVSERRYLGGLGPRQRERLLLLLTARPSHRPLRQP